MSFYRVRRVIPIDFQMLFSSSVRAWRIVAAGRRHLLLALILSAMLMMEAHAANAVSPASVTPAAFDDQMLVALDQATDLAFTPDQRLLITQQQGQLLVWTATSPPQVALDLESILCFNRERGLLGVEVDPEFETNHYIYLYYTFINGSHCGSTPEPTPINRVSRFTLSDQNSVDPSTELILLDNIPSPAGIHNAGDLSFGKDGFLYISVGDGGCHYIDYFLCGINNRSARQLHVLSGKILRLTRDGAIPASNPLQDADSVRCNTTGRTQSGKKCQEIFAWGLRNPYRFAFDPNAADTRFFINDVGQSRWEEIDLGQAGADYGWNVREGHCVAGSFTNCGAPPAGMVNPLYDYPRSSGCSAITGGAFVPNGLWPAEYDGAYLYGDWVCGKIFMLTAPNEVYTAAEFVTEAGGVTAMTFGPYEGSQALYYLVYGFPGELRRLAFTGADNRAPSAALAADPTSGPLPLQVTFDATASSDPDAADTLTYLWDFGDGTGTIETTEATTTHTYETKGVYTASLQVRDSHGMLSPLAATVQIFPGNTPPQPSIISPDPQLRFAVDQIITLEGSAIDAEEGVLPESALTWEVRRHHNEHFHPYVPPTTGNGLTFVGPPPEELTFESKEWLAILLTGTDSQGLSQTVTRMLEPNSVPIIFESEPPGIPFSVDGEATTGPYLLVSREGLGFDVAAQEILDLSGQLLRFESWSDGGAASHTLFTPALPTTYTVTYDALASITLLLEVSDVDLSFSLGDPALAPAGVIRIDARLRNLSTSTIDGVLFRVRKVSGASLLNADGGPGGQGAILTLPAQYLGDGLLQPDESFSVTFRIGLQRLNRLRFVLDAFGVIEGGEAGAAVENEGIVFDISEQELQELSQGNSLYLPNLNR
jgi:glucose/arabinose dehydrogenase